MCFSEHLIIFAEAKYIVCVYIPNRKAIFFPANIFPLSAGYTRSSALPQLQLQGMFANNFIYVKNSVNRHV